MLTYLSQPFSFKTCSCHTNIDSQVMRIFDYLYVGVQFLRIIVFMACDHFVSDMIKNT